MLSGSVDNFVLPESNDEGSESNENDGSKNYEEEAKSTLSDSIEDEGVSLRDLAKIIFPGLKTKSPPKSTAECCKKYRDNMNEEQSAKEKKKLQQSTEASQTRLQKPKARYGLEAQRRKWREEKRKQRQNLTGQKKRRHREKMLQSYYDKK
ncbi:hypothetical protein PoB_004393500, partial [Plakobranchus ocellatus]